MKEHGIPWSEGDLKMSGISELFFTFAKIGLFTFGGGYAMISVIENECVDKKKWITHDEMMDITVIAESTPGPIAINCATFVGHKMAGFAGAVFTTLGVVAPSFAIIYLISIFLDNFLEIALVADAFQGIKAAVGILILNAAVNMMKKMKKTAWTGTVMLCSLACMLLINIFSWNFSSISLMVIAAAASLICFTAQDLRSKESGKK